MHVTLLPAEVQVRLLLVVRSAIDAVPPEDVAGVPIRRPDQVGMHTSNLA